MSLGKSLFVDEISLVALWEVNSEALFRAVDENRTHLRRWLPWVDGTHSSQDTIRFQNLNQALASEGRALVYCILVEDQVGGVMGFNTIDRANRSGVIGYWLIEAFQRRGMATRSLSALLSHAFFDLELNRVVITAATGNRRSQCVAERLGFQREGVSRQAERLNDGYVDAIVYSLLRHEFSKDRGLVPSKR